MEADFSGYATKADLVCSDGRTITPDAFKHQDKMTVPLVWQHGHNSIDNILGHADLEWRHDGVYARAFCNATPQGQQAKSVVEHGDVKFFSIYANQLVEKGKTVLHGMIKEVSLVLAGANPGALIDYVRVAHSDDTIETLDDEAVITTGLELAHGDGPVFTASATQAGDVKPKVEPKVEPKTGDNKVIVHVDQTLKDVYDTMTPEQKNLVDFMVGAALEDASTGSTQHSETGGNTTSEGNLNHQEGNGTMTRNVFEQANTAPRAGERKTLTHDQLHTIVADAQKLGSFRESVLAHAVEYGIENIDTLFPDPKTIYNTPEFVSRRMEWVASFWGGLRKNPFSRIKTFSADITQDEARAKGYIKGNLKKEEWFTLSNRVTTPTTVYKKQKLDRDDIIDITDFDVVAWLKAEMRVMLDEEIARAALVGDGREIDDEDKINESNIRPIAFEDDFYAHKVTVASTVTGDALVDAILTNRQYYRGAGNPTMYTTEAVLSEMLLVKDGMNRRLYNTVADLAAAARVSDIVPVPVMEGVHTNTGNLIFVLVNPSDYTIGADSGGNIAMFDDFDIDYNQYKYLIETRCSGALTKFKTAMVFSRADAAGDVNVTPTTPAFVSGTGVVTIPTVAGVVYKNKDTGDTLTAGAQTALNSGQTLNVLAVPASGYVFPHNTDADWSFTRP